MPSESKDPKHLAFRTVAHRDAHIAALEAELRAAQLTADVAALDRLISDDLLFTAAVGRDK